MCHKFRSFGEQMSDFRKKPYFIVLGLMSGTSTDGLDLALCRFEKIGKHWDSQILQAKTQRYSSAMKFFLRNAAHLSAVELAAAHLQYGKFIGLSVQRFLKDNSEKPMLIASHGHTIFHQPQKLACFQLGHGGAIASITGIACVNDFRLQDIILGGQGAPLVPLGDRELFSSFDACLNLGGIANISFKMKKTHLAFDVSPCNLPLNFVISKTGKSYDKGGKKAASGHINPSFLGALNRLSYYRQQGPKSLGREWIEKKFLPIIDQFTPHLNSQDILATVCEHIAFQIGSIVRRNHLKKVLVTGGGAHHLYLIERIRYHSNGTEIIIPDNNIIDFKEALIFAFLGLNRYLSVPNTLPSVTGSLRPSCSGSLWLP